MTQLTYYTPRSPLTRLLAPLLAGAVSYLPPRALRPLVGPCVRACRASRRPGLRRRASHTIDPVAGDGMAIRVRRLRSRSR